MNYFNVEYVHKTNQCENDNKKSNFNSFDFILYTFPVFIKHNTRKNHI